MQKEITLDNSTPSREIMGFFPFDCIRTSFNVFHLLSFVFSIFFKWVVR